MSGSIGGVDASIPLRAGQGIGAPQDPLERFGKFVGVSNEINRGVLQQQAITSGKATVAQHLQQIGSNAMAPFLAIENPTMKDLTNALARAEGVAGGTTQHLMQIAQNNPFPPDTPQWGAYMKRSIAALAQTDPTAMVGQAAGVLADQNAGGVIFSGTRAPATSGGGFAPSTQTNVSMTPGEAAQQVRWRNSDGGEEYGTNLQYNEALRNGRATGPATVVPIPRGGATPSTSPGATPAFGNPGGRYQPTNPALRNSATPAAVPADGGPPAPGTPQPVPLPAQRVTGAVYPTPRGPMKWTGTGWLPAGAQ